MKNKLNKKQLQAIKHTKGPLLIIAGAGTGKTTVITERIKNLIQNGFAKPEEILALTFTEKAATEMEVRVDEAMPLSYGDVWITTFHSFCDSVLRESGLHIGLPTNFKLMTKEKSVDLFKRNLFNFSLNYFRPLGNPNKFIYSLLTHFSRLQDELITAEEYQSWVKSKYKGQNKEKSNDEKLEQQKWEELAVVYKEYDDLKLIHSKFDFGDLVIKTVELFKKRPNILRKYQEKFKYILVDEFQDTNYGQNILVNLLAQKSKNINVVGDDNQSIYRFRGASVSNILSFKEEYPKAKIITLNQNYRSTQNILDGAYKLIKHNDPDTLEVKMGISKKLTSNSNKHKVDIESLNCGSGASEAEYVANKILELSKKFKYSFSDFAILVRANNHSDIFVKEFERMGIPHQFLGPSSLFLKEEIVDLLSYLKSLYDPEDTESIYRLLSSKTFAIEPIKLVQMLSLAKKESRSLLAIVAENNIAPKLINLFNRHLSEINQKLTGQILYDFLQEFGIYEDILKNEDEVRAKNIAAFFQKVESFENENPLARLREVVDYLNLLSEVGDTPQVANEEWQENNCVNILTVHSSKGLEFPVVFIVNLVADRFPSRNRSEDLPIPDELVKEKLPEGDFHLQEERRLMYVAMTRAKERLFLTSSKFYSAGASSAYNDGKREKKISPFVYEAMGEMESVAANKKEEGKLIKDRVTMKSNTVEDKKDFKVTYLSVSQIETFETCPLHYKLKYIYKLPTPKTASISFGISIHETLKNLYLTEDKSKINEKWLLKKYNENFIHEGFENKKHKDQFYKKGEEYLIGFLKNSYNKNIVADKLEHKFTLSLFKDLKIGGTIDRVDKVSNNELEVIDYKTTSFAYKTGASIPTQKEVDKDLQLSIYALAVSDIYKVKPENIKLSLYYLDTQEKISTTRTLKDLQEMKDKIYEYKQKIESSDFKCNNSYFCQKGCEFKMFCGKE